MILSWARFSLAGHRSNKTHSSQIDRSKVISRRCGCASVAACSAEKWMAGQAAGFSERRPMWKSAGVNTRPADASSSSTAAALLWDAMIRVANGRWTCAEVMRHNEVVMTKLYVSA